jgi:hypothetical protein
LYELDVPATLLGQSQKLYQQTNPAGINHGNLSEVDDNASIPAAKCILDGLAQAVHGGTRFERSPKLN